MSSTTVSPKVSSADQRTIVVGASCGLVFFSMMAVLLLIVYRKVPLCCKTRVYQESRTDTESPQYFNSRQTLVASSDAEQTHGTGLDHVNAQSGSLFLIGVPSSYYLSSLDPPLPRLPSYESVRKKDRQRQIHMMITDRFGLNAAVVTELPPTYEESICQSVQSIDGPFDILAPEEEPSHDPASDLPAYGDLPQITDSLDPNDTLN
ncbi:uncharacterized protein LOC127944977 isoform X1 [Carassius gibelio]|uniref:uncharacterized protein LOC127944977 isoform X1 n=1 Tax=Carassius gibelio TaxID=101364 RepID=UPI00227982C6|nr:uncharacterized protein LOC127944977 isoform X1 [Carassius gibelio]